MPVIDPKGLFEGQRLAACSDRAQSYWPRLYCAANGYARLELHGPSIVGRCFSYYREPPSVEQLLAVIAEYSDNFLVIPYQARGQFWVQFATEEKFLRRRKTADDERSPAPPPESLKTFAAGYSAWKEKHQKSANPGDSSISQMFPNYFRNISEAFPPGVGVGVGDGDGDGDGDGENKINFLTPPSTTTELDEEVFEDKSPTDEVVLSAKDERLPPGKRAIRKQQRAAVRRLFNYYLNGTERNPKLYSLTLARMDKGLLRLKDCQQKCDGDLVKAEKVMLLAIDAMLASEYHSGKNEQHKEYTDWIDNLFKSTEKLEWWLAR